MGRKAGRSPQATRRAILDATTEAIAARGRSASLADIARTADVTKGGLLYHFSSKEDLLEALAEDAISVFEQMVTEQIDPDDHEPGRLCRAYVRATMTPDAPDGSFLTQAVVLTTMMTEPRVEAMFREAIVRLRERLYDDGLPRATVTLVITAADGASVQPFWGATMDPLDRSELLHQLVSLTRVGATAETDVRPPA